MGVRSTAVPLMEHVEAAYEGHLDVMTMEREYCEGPEAQLALVERYREMSDAYEDVREYLDYRQTHLYKFD